MDTVEGISHRPGQEGDSSNCSNVKEWGCGLWITAGEEESSSYCSSPLRGELLEF